MSAGKRTRPGDGDGARLTVGPETVRMLELGHPWVIADRYTRAWPTVPPGALATLCDGNGRALATELIGNGAALERFREIIALQSGDPAVIDDLDRLPRAANRTPGPPYAAQGAGRGESMP